MTTYRYVTIYHTTILTAYRLISIGQDQVVIGLAGQHADLLANRLSDVIQSTPGHSITVAQIEDLCQRFIRHFQQTYQQKYRSPFDGDVLEGIGILWLTNQATGRGYQWGKCQLTVIDNQTNRSLVQVSGQIQEFTIAPGTRLVIDLQNTDAASFAAVLPEQTFADGDHQELLTRFPYSFSVTLVQALEDDIPELVRVVPSVSELQTDLPPTSQDRSEDDQSINEFPSKQSFAISGRQVAYIGAIIGLMLAGWLGWYVIPRDQIVGQSADSLSLGRPLLLGTAKSEQKAGAIPSQDSLQATTAPVDQPTRSEQDTMAQEQLARLSLLRADGALSRADVCIQEGQNTKARKALDIADKNYRTYLKLKPHQMKMIRFRKNRLNQLRAVIATKDTDF